MIFLSCLWKTFLKGKEDDAGNSKLGSPNKRVYSVQISLCNVVSPPGCLQDHRNVAPHPSPDLISFAPLSKTLHVMHTRFAALGLKFSEKPIRRTQIQGERKVSNHLLPTIITTTTSNLGAQRIFSSLSLILQRSTARTATQKQSLLSCTVLITTTRNYARGKGKRMPPKKPVKEEKILLGRPGNNLKSGIVY